jgi:hypothetical protein
LGGKAQGRFPSSTILFNQDFFNGHRYARQIIGADLPYDIEIDAEIVVYQAISYAGRILNPPGQT